MSRRSIDEMSERIATGCHDVWSFGPFRRPSTALRRVAKWLRRNEKPDPEDGRDVINAVEDVRLIHIGKTWWVEVQFDNASLMGLLPKDSRFLS